MHFARRSVTSSELLELQSIAVRSIDYAAGVIVRLVKVKNDLREDADFSLTLLNQALRLAAQMKPVRGTLRDYLPPGRGASRDRRQILCWYGLENR